MSGLNEEKLYMQAVKNNGYITYSEVEHFNMSKSVMLSLVKQGKYRRIGKGIFILGTYSEDFLYSLSLKYTKLLFARRTALYLNNMTNKQLLVIDGNFPQGYNSGKIKEINCHHPRGLKFELGATKIETEPGNTVNTYDKERCICDLFLYDDFDLEETKYAINEYKRGLVDLDKLYSYAEKLNVLVQVKSIFEVII